jgi:hypothetical protein
LAAEVVMTDKPLHSFSAVVNIAVKVLGDLTELINYKAVSIKHYVFC